MSTLRPTSPAPGVPAASRTIRSIDPHDGSLVGEVTVATAADVEAAVSRAAAAASAWRGLGFERRAELLVAAGEAVAGAAEELGQLMHREMGKPVDSATAEALGSGKMAAGHVEGSKLAVAAEVFTDRGMETTLHHEPLGVVGVITPWNFPLSMPASLVYPALLVGNTVVLKPSEKTPLVGARFAEILSAALPPGVLEHVAGDGATGAALVAARVQAIAFVGSQVVGREIMRAAAVDLKRLVLELGGKDPMIVLADADLEKASAFAAMESVRNAGQVCCSVERIYVEESIAERFETMVAEQARGIEIGPMVDDGQRQKVVAQIEDARSKGARILVGGEAPAGPGSRFPPTVVADTSEDMLLLSEETFGPVVTLRRVRDADQALELANTTEFGLGATVWSADEERARAIAEQLAAGMVGINKGIGAVGDAPWVGARQSGYGFMGSVEGIRHFTQPKTVTRRVAEPQS